jgi:hypothetical protein
MRWSSLEWFGFFLDVQRNKLIIEWQRWVKRVNATAHRAKWNIANPSAIAGSLDTPLNEPRIF